MTNVRIIAGGAFRDCSNLTSITIPSSVTSIGSQAFLGCFALDTVIFEDQETEWTADFNGGTEIYIITKEDLKNPSTMADYLTGDTDNYISYSSLTKKQSA